MISSAAPLPGPAGEHDRTHSALVLSDRTASIYIAGTTNVIAGFQEGDRLVIDGFTDPGQFAPFVRAAAVRKIGNAVIPPPMNATYQTLVTGGLDAQWVEVSGVVRSWEPLDPGEMFGSWVLVLAVDGNKVTATATGPHPPGVESDAEVQIRCICFYQFNQQRQVLNPALLMPRTDPVKIIRPAPANPFATPIRPLASMLQFGNDNVFGHRIHLRATVTFQQSTEMLWIRDQSGAAGIQTLPAEKLQPGDVVDVLGFTRYGSTVASPGSAVSGSAVLEDAVVHKADSVNPPDPARLTTVGDAFKHDADLVSVAATLVDVQPILGGDVFDLQVQGKTFKAVLKISQPQLLLHTLRPGSRVQVTGICSIIGDDSNFVISGVWHPQSFQVLLRSAADLTVIKLPPWWTPGHVILVLGMATVGLMIVVGALTLLARHRLNEQEHQRAMAEAEFAAILSERNRVAREIHDTLAQGLVATSVQLRLAKKQADHTSVTLNQHLDAALQMVRGSLDEARNSIWNMRSQVLETNDLGGALGGILKQMVDGTDVDVSVDITGRPRRLAPVVESNVLRLGQEAITNAVKHARSTQIKVRLDFGEKQFRLDVMDNGRGFDPDNPPPSDGGFGLMGMRERATGLNGELSIKSAQGGGTEIQFRLPLSGE